MVASVDPKAYAKHVPRHEKELVDEFLKFMVIKAWWGNETDAGRFSPSPYVDLVWYEAILDTRYYLALCDSLTRTVPSFEDDAQGDQEPGGRWFIYHDPSGAAEDVKLIVARLKRREETLVLHTYLFTTSPPWCFWDCSVGEEESFFLFVKTMTGRKFKVEVCNSTIIKELANQCIALDGGCLFGLRLIYAGQVVFPDSPFTFEGGEEGEEEEEVEKSIAPQHKDIWKRYIKRVCRRPLLISVFDPKLYSTVSVLCVAVELNFF